MHNAYIFNNVGECDNAGKVCDICMTTEMWRFNSSDKIIQILNAFHYLSSPALRATRSKNFCIIAVQFRVYLHDNRCISIITVRCMRGAHVTVGAAAKKMPPRRAFSIPPR